MEDRIIYIADMDVAVKQLLKQSFEACNYRIKLFDNGEKLVWECNRARPDFVIMDVKLHGIDGFEVCRKLRQEANTSDLPILFLTEKNDEFDIVLGLELGADDYMVKPFSIRELQSRIKALFRRTQMLRTKSDFDKLKLNNLEFDVQGRTINNGNISIKFSLKEFELLMFMISNSGVVLSRDYLLERIWGANFYNGTRTVDVHIRNIRKKLDELDCTHSYIESIRRSGYRFNENMLNGKVG